MIRLILQLLSALALGIFPIVAEAQTSADLPPPPVVKGADAVPPAIAQAVQAERRVSDRATALARLLNSEATIIGDTASDEKAIALIPQLFGSNPELAQLEKKYPGLGLQLARALIPVVNRSMRERLPQLQQRQAELYAAHFSAEDLDTLIEFYGSPTGVKLIREMMQAVKPKHMLEEAAQSTDLRFGASSAIADIRDTAPGVVKAMNAEDQAVLLKLAGSGLMTKLQALAPQTQKIAIDWMNESTPEEEAEVSRIVEAIIIDRAKKAK